MRSPLSATITLMFTSLLWGAAWLPLKALNAAGVDGINLILTSYSILLLLSLPVLARHGGVIRQRWPMLAAIVLLGGAANLCFSYALIYGNVIRVMVLFYLLPVWGVLGGRFILHEHTSPWRWAGVLLAVMGAFILLGGPLMFKQPPSWLDLIALASGIFFALSNLVFRGLDDVPLAPKMSALFLGSCFMAGCSLIVLQLPVTGFTPNFPWGYVILYSTTWLLVANVGSQWAVTQMPAGRSSIIIILELITAVVTATLIAHETITLQIVVGGLLVMSATAMEIFAGEKPSAIFTPAAKNLNK